MKAKILLPVLLFLCILSTAACTGGNNGSTSGSRTEIDNPWWETKNDVEYDEDGNVIFEEVEIDLASVVAGEDLGAFNDIVQKFLDMFSLDVCDFCAINGCPFNEFLVIRIITLNSWSFHF